MNRFSVYRIGIIALFVLLFSLQTSAAQASTGDYEHYVLSGAGTCTDVNIRIPVVKTYSYSANQSIVYTNTIWVNGVFLQTGSSPRNPAAGSGTTNTKLSASFSSSNTMPYSYRHRLVVTESNVVIGAIDITATCDNGVATAFLTPIPASDAGYMPPPPVFDDGRLNMWDAGETAAVYCEADGSVKVMSIYNSKGYLAFLASSDEIAKVPKNPTTNTAIKSGNGATLYRLTSGELQVNRAENETGKMYYFIFQDCPTK